MKRRDMIFPFIFLLVIAIFFSVSIIVPSHHSYSIVKETSSEGAVQAAFQKAVSQKESSLMDAREVIKHVPLPEQVKAIYMTSCVAGTPSFRNKLVSLINETELNTLVIDVKDYSGTISFNPGVNSAWYPAWRAGGCGVADLKYFIAELHKLGVFTIARITVFQDPFYAPQHPELAVTLEDRETVWEDKKGLSFIDVGAQAYWDHIVNLATLSYNLGFDEINFDYVRYPSDGNLKNIAFPQSEVGEYGMDKDANLEAFFAYITGVLRQPEQFDTINHVGGEQKVPYLSVDLFGMTTTARNGMNIGQVFERALPYFDFVAPMVYPSHYPDGFLGLDDPNSDPYAIVMYAMQSAVTRANATTTTIRGFTHTPIPKTVMSKAPISGIASTTQFTATTTAVYGGVQQYTKNAYTSSRLRTWIQDFDYGGDYGPEEVRAQIQASRDAGVDSYMIWAPSNIYTRAALEMATTTEIAVTPVGEEH